jgi:hypothetical protein
MQDTAVLQRFLAQFPKQIIREKISKNKEFLGGIRQFDLQNFKFRRGHAECVSASQPQSFENWALLPHRLPTEPPSRNATAPR